MRRIIIGTLAVVFVWGGLLEASADEPRNWDIVPIPLVGYGPDFGVIFALAAVGVYGPNVGIPETDRQADRADNVVVANILGTTNGSLLLVASGRHFFREDRYLLDMSGAYSSFPREYYGVGPDTDIPQSYRSRSISWEGSINRQIVPDFFIGPLAEIESFTVTESDAGGSFSGYEDFSVGGGFRLIRDTTDGSFAPDTGFVFDTDIRAFAGYGLYRGDLTVFVTPFGRVVTAFQTRFVQSWGDVPLHRLPSIGGDGTIRGYLEDRWRDSTAVSGQMEIRVPLFWRLGATGFVGAGQVGPGPAALDPGTIKPAGGVGLRILLSEEQKLNFRFDFAVGSEGTAFYINAREAF